MAFFVFLGFFAFGGADEQEEIDFLLFSPNSSNQFVNEDQAKIQLDNIAKYLMGRNLISGQIFVYGYASAAINDIEPIALSRDRALFVISELQKRGILKDFFSAPIGYGEVDFWGGNTNEEDRVLNRRVRILLDGDFLTPGILKAADSDVKPSSAAAYEKSKEESSSKFPWWILLPLLLLALILFLLKRKKRPANDPIAAVPISYHVVNLEEEIRLRAYELYRQRNGGNEDAEGDWYIALPEICAKYETAGYQVYTKDGSWWARWSSG